MKVLRFITYTLMFLALLAIYFGAIIYFGVRQGEQEQVDNYVATANAEVVSQYDLALEDINTGNYALAQKRIDYIIERLPYTTDSSSITEDDAVALYETVVDQQQSRSVLLIPTLENNISSVVIRTVEPGETVTPDVNATPTLTPPDTPTPNPDELEMADALIEIEAILEARQWEAASSALLAFQIENPAYERYYTDKLLYQALINTGYVLTSGNEVARGVNYFEHAQRLGSLDAAAFEQMNAAQMYLQGLAYRGARWDLSILNFNDLCESRPDFHNSCQLLFDAYIVYAEALLDDGNACAAVTQLQTADRLSQTFDDYSNTAQQALGRTQSRCANPNSNSAQPPQPTRPNGRWTDTPTPRNQATPTPRSGGRWTATPTPQQGGRWTATPTPRN